MPHCLSSRSLLRTRTYSPIALQGSPQRRGRRQFPSPQVCLEYVENIEEKVGAKRVVYSKKIQSAKKIARVIPIPCKISYYFVWHLPKYFVTCRRRPGTAEDCWVPDRDNKK